MIAFHPCIPSVSFWAPDVLRKLLNDPIGSCIRSKVVETRAFTAHLEDAIALPRQRHHQHRGPAGADPIRAGHRAASCWGEEQGLSDEEIACYDAPAGN